jgi:tetratricopeptide (TPR) repeat protein
MAESDHRADLFQLQMRSAEVFAQQGRLEDMRAVMARALPAVERPSSLFERFEKFKLLAALRRYPEAIAEAERILDEELSHRTVEVVKFPWSRVLFARADTQAAFEDDRRLLRALARRRPRSPWAGYFLAQLKYRPDAEQAACLEAAARAPAARYGWMRREVGVMRLEHYDYAGAVEAFRVSARSTKPGLWRSHAFCAETYVFLGRGERALREFLRAVEAAPDYEKGEALAWMGELCLWLGRYEDALRLCEEAIPRGGLYGYCWRAAALLKLGRTEEALQAFDLGLKVMPRDREAYMWRGETRRIVGDDEGALADLNEAPLEGVAPSRWMWHDFNRALVHAALGSEDAMIADYNRIPSWVTGYLRGRLGLDPAGRPSSAERIRVLNEGLALSRGYRRPEHHGQAAWMGEAGRRGPHTAAKKA